ncbi:MAG: lipid kinase [Acetobacteraceae bacterium]|nr:lipid kinase [Acetobacteraceae bacterium]
MAAGRRRLTGGAPPRALLVANPKSRSGGDPDTVAGLLREAGLAPVCPSLDGQGTAALIRAHAAEVDRVVLAGGDGTMNAAAPALLETGLPFAIIPMGTGNDLARTLGVPEDPAEAARVAAEGRLRAIDVGLANDVPFFNVASVGFGVDLTRALTGDAKRRWGKLGYAVAGLRVLARMHPFRATIRCGDEVVRSRTVHVAVGNGRHYGGGMTVSERTEIDDGKLDVFSLEVGGVWGLLRLLPALRRGDHGRWQEVLTAEGQEIEIRTRRRRSVNTDGEITTRTPVLFRVLHGAARVFVPPPPQDGPPEVSAAPPPG